VLHTLLVAPSDAPAYNDFNNILLEVISKPQVGMNILKATLKVAARLVDLGLPLNRRILPNVI